MFIKHIILILFFSLTYFQIQRIASTQPGTSNERALTNTELHFFSLSVYFKNEVIQEEFNKLNLFMIPKVKDFVMELINSQIKHGQQYETFYLEFIFLFYLILLILTYFTLSFYFIPSMILLMNYGASLYKYYLLNKESNIYELEPWKSMDVVLNGLIIFFILINYLCCSCSSKRKIITIHKTNPKINEEERSKEFDVKSEQLSDETDEKTETPGWQ